jgi:8-oxo-dGTP pyrophosphatase MutT (NUDIX family)
MEDEAPARRTPGPQTIPRPSEGNVRPGRPAPWHGVPAGRRSGITLDVLLERLDAAGRNLALTEPPDPVDELSGMPQSTASGLADSAVLVAVFEREGEARIILTRRSGHLRRHRGEVSFPGGRLDAGESAVDGALREAHEEVGLDPALVTPVAWLHALATLASGSLIRPIVATLGAEPLLVAQPTEVERAFDVSLADLLEDGAFREERWRRPSPRGGADAEGFFPIYFYDVAGETIWGATARILTELCCIAVGVSVQLR